MVIYLAQRNRLIIQLIFCYCGITALNPNQLQGLLSYSHLDYLYIHYLWNKSHKSKKWFKRANNGMGTDIVRNEISLHLTIQIRNIEFECIKIVIVVWQTFFKLFILYTTIASLVVSQEFALFGALGLSSLVLKAQVYRETEIHDTDLLGMGLLIFRFTYMSMNVHF